MFSPGLLNYPKLSSDFFNLLSHMLDRSLATLAAYDKVPAPVDWNCIFDIIKYGLKSYGYVLMPLLTD